MLRDTLVRTGRVGRGTKEAVAVAVSGANACPYCADVHGTILADLARTGTGGAATVAAPEVLAWAAVSGDRVRAGHRPVPGDPADLPELLGTAVTFQYLNRMVNVHLAGSFLPPRAPVALHGGLRRVLGRILRARPWPGTDAPGLDLPAAPLPADLSWAAATPAVARAFGYAARAMAAAGERSVPEPVRELLRHTVSRWDGRPVGPAVRFDDAVARLPRAHRPAGRLALLTALASYRVGSTAIAEFRREQPGDGPLLDLTAWASFTAAREIGGWARTGTHGPAATRAATGGPAGGTAGTG